MTDKKKLASRARARAWAQQNPERAKARLQAWRAANRAHRNAYEKLRRARTPEVSAYKTQRHQSLRRGIPFLLTIEEWWSIWEESGKWDARGCRKDQYVMARFGDAGAYEVGNVRICTVGENAIDRGRYLSDQSRAKMSASAKARQGTSSL